MEIAQIQFSRILDGVLFAFKPELVFTQEEARKSIFKPHDELSPPGQLRRRNTRLFPDASKAINSYLGSETDLTFCYTYNDWVNFEGGLSGMMTPSSMETLKGGKGKTFLTGFT